MDNMSKESEILFGPLKEKVRLLEPALGTPLFQVDPENLVEIATYLQKAPLLHGTLSLEWAVDLHPMEPSVRIYYLFSLGPEGRWVIIYINLPESVRSFPSITPKIHGAKWYEREIRDLFGLIPSGHPDQRRLVRHEHWPKGAHPLKKDFIWNTTM